VQCSAVQWSAVEYHRRNNTTRISVPRLLLGTALHCTAFRQTTQSARKTKQKAKQSKNKNKNKNKNNEKVAAAPRSRGPTLALNVVRSDGTMVGYNEVSKLAALHHPPLQFRTGCFCNPGACQVALGLDDRRAIDHYETSGHVCGDHIDLVHGKPTGAVRVSFGKDSTWEDMDVFVGFLESTFRDHSEVTEEGDGAAAAATAATTSATTSASIAADASSTPASSETRVSVSELYLFPIKSCAAQRAASWPLVLPSGKLKYDREFAIVDTNGIALRLQTCPKLGLVRPVIDLHAGTMTVSAPGVDDLFVRLSDDLYHGGGENVVQVCGNRCGGKVWGDASVSEWFASVLGIQCWLARYDHDHTRNHIRNHIRNDESRSRSPSSTASRPGFSNEQPILLVSEHAVERLNGVLREQQQPPCSAKRFRANIVIAHPDRQNHTASPHQDRGVHIEDNWKTVSLSLPDQNFDFSVEGDCPRCTMVDYDPETGQKKGKTLRALASYRRKNGHIVFGIFLRATHSTHRMGMGMGRGVRRHHDNGKTESDPSQTDTIWIREGDTLVCR